MSGFIENGNHSDQTFKCLLELPQKHAISPLLIRDGIGNQQKQSNTSRRKTKNTCMHEGKSVFKATINDKNKVATMGVIWSWGKEYEGTGDPSEFIRRTEELAEAYRVELNHAAGAMTVLLIGSALDWWHIHPTPMPSKSIFRKEGKSNAAQKRKTWNGLTETVE